jgi:20S proteasome alpha/beta subunit
MGSGKCYLPSTLFTLNTIVALISLLLLTQSVRFLAYVDLLGTTYSASTLATGYGSYIAQPLLRKAVEGNEDTLTEADAVRILGESMKVLYYRDARSLNKVSTISMFTQPLTSSKQMLTFCYLTVSTRKHNSIWCRHI